MNVFKDLRSKVVAQLEDMASAGEIPAGLDFSRVAAEPPRDSSHGDVATNAAMVLSKVAGMKPRDLASLLATRLENLDVISSVEIAGPGFINLRLDEKFWFEQVGTILKAGTSYGDSDMGQGEKVNVEYVSANPTGPLTVGHARGAVVGDALAALLAKVGYDVSKEYYINDAGNQVNVLANSAYLRYREALGEDIGEIPEGFYPGEYLKAVGKALADRDGDKWLGKEEADWISDVRKFAIDQLLDLIRGDLAALGVVMDVYSSERALVEAGGVDEVMKFLEANDLVYTGVLEPPKGKKPDDWEARPQTLFKSTDFGDDVDRPIKKSDSSWTYFAGDMAYHLDKYRRGFNTMINVWGADHGGYIKRMQAAVTAMTEKKGSLDVKVCQLVNLMRGGEMVRMSKRSGNFITLRSVIDEVGKDVVRFIMLTRKNDASLDFDLEKVVEQSRDNPVFYVQYAHARSCSVLKHSQNEFPDMDLSIAALEKVDLSELNSEGELSLIRRLCEWPRLLESAGEAHEPHRIAFYLYELAAELHGLWTKGKDNARLRFIVTDDQDLTQARMALVKATSLVIASGLNVFGIEPAEEMR
ncbi:arginyl-tRNA synthetase [Kiloniella spongiae]|uniref:Arginine--tRNA ligase n=1 Tax=Kiloniella spongiae TaxID=1489064 RepID=A0A0H2MXP4_9PROT|nr:arginine--tRNA ligase [Kiloniella spongiae]KLN61445.1 arginyl-tRNA synthetase [Kiloniella spongiae]